MMADQMERIYGEEEIRETGSSERTAGDMESERGQSIEKEKRAAAVPAEPVSPAEAAGAAEPVNPGEAARSVDSAESADLSFGVKKRSWFFRFLLCVLSFLIVSGLIGLVYYVLDLEPFGVKAVTIDDAKIQYIDFFTYLVDVLNGVRSPVYDFSNLLGGNTVGAFSYYLTSPFNLLLLYFGKEGVYQFFDVAVLLKLGTAAATFAWYLQRRCADRIRPVFVVALSMGYGMMQYCVQQSSNIMWLDGVYMLPLVLLGVYEVVHKKSVWRLALAVALTICFNWYIAGVSCLFSGIWFVFEYFFRDVEEGAGSPGKPPVQIASEDAASAGAGPAGGKGGKRADFSEERREREERRAGGEKEKRAGRRREEKKGGWLAGFTDFFLSFCRYVWGMGLGVGLSAILFLPVISAMRQGTGQYDEIKFLMEMRGDFLSVVRGYVIGTMSDRGYAALFCGGIAVTAAAALVFSGGFRIRQKAAFLGLAGICFLMLHWEPAMLAFSLLKKADSYWYRYGYLIGFALLFGAGAYLSRAERDKWSKAFMVVASLLFAAAVLKLNGIHIPDLQAQGLNLVLTHKAVFATAGSAVVLAVLTVFLLSGRRAEENGKADDIAAGNIENADNAESTGDSKNGRTPGVGIRFLRVLAAILLLAVTAVELWANAWLYWRTHTDDSQEMYLAYSEGMQKQLAQLRAVDGGLYRIGQDRTRWHYEDDLTAYFNDSLAQNYWSNAAYTSSQDDTQLSLMWRLGYRDEGGRMLIVRDPMIASDAFLGVKYLLESTPVEGLMPVNEVEPFNGRTVYRNPYALPMAFVYDGSKLPTMRYDSTFVYQNMLYTTLSGKKTELYVPLTWTERTDGNKSFFTVYIPEKAKGSQHTLVAYGNLLWQAKKSGLISVNGTDPVGYCRWMSPAAFLIRSRQEQAQSGEDQSLQAAVREKQAQERAAKAAEAAKNGEILVEEETELSLQKKELAQAAAAFDKEVLKNSDGTGFSDIRTVVFRSDEDLAFKDYQFYGLDLDALQEVTDRIRTGEVSDVKIENGHVQCTVEGSRGRSLCLLVPWSKGWEATRNGEPVQPDTVAGAMITIPLVDGKNNIEMNYHVPYLQEGMYVSAAALVVILLDALIRWAAARKSV